MNGHSAAGVAPASEQTRNFGSIEHSLPSAGGAGAVASSDSASPGFPIPNAEDPTPLDRVADHSPHVVLITDTTGAIKYVNPKFTEMTGYTLPEVLGKNPRFLKSGRLSDETYRHLWSTISRGREWRGVLHNRKKSGEVYWEQTQITPIRDNAGVVTHYLAVKEDVSARRTIENALHHSEERLRSVLESNQAGYFNVNPDGVIEQVNVAWLALHGYDSPSDVIGMPLSDTIAPGDVGRIWKAIADTMGGGKVPATEFTRRGRDGTTGQNSFSCQVLRKDNKVIGVEGFIIDTSALHALEARYENLFNRITDGVALHEMIYDESGTPIDYVFLTVNPAFEQICGRPRSEIIGRTARELFPDTPPRWIHRFSEVLASGESQRFADTCSGPDGHRQHFEISAFIPERGRFACIVQDVTQRRQLEDNIRQAQKMEAIGQLAGGVAHDFNNLLTGIIMQLDLLCLDHEHDPKTVKALSDVTVEARRAASLTQQLLVFSRRQACNPETLDLNRVCSDLLKMLRCVITENIQISFNPSSDPCWIVADTSMVQQVLMNLCVNARDAMKHGGDLTITVQRLAVTEETAFLKPGLRVGNFVSLCVSDTGEGMSEATRKHIFEPFFTTKDVGKGTGLGLSTVFGIVNQHDGWIDVQSDSGKGATFTVYFPASSLPGSVFEEHPAPTSRSPGDFSILLVEDTLTVRTLAGTALRRAGYTVHEAANGAEALETWTKVGGKIDVLLSDMVMPGHLTGEDIAHAFRRQKPDLQVIISSGYRTDHRSIDQDPESNPSDFMSLPKPYQLSALLQTVQECTLRLTRSPA